MILKECFTFIDGFFYSNNNLTRISHRRTPFSFTAFPGFPGLGPGNEVEPVLYKKNLKKPGIIDAGMLKSGTAGDSMRAGSPKVNANTAQSGGIKFNEYEMLSTQRLSS